MGGQRVLVTGVGTFWGGRTAQVIEQDAVDVLTPLGFKEYRIPDYGADPDGNVHDMSKLVYTFE